MGRTKKKPDLDESNVGVNPFEQKLEVRVRSGYNKRIKGGVEVKEEWESEYDPYTKVYEIKGYKANMQSLPIRSKEMLLFLIHSVESGRDWIWINRVEYMKDNNINSVNTYMKALKVLCDEGYISRHPKTDVYWINPQVFFKGNRIKKFHHKIKEMDGYKKAKLETNFK